MAAKLKAGGYGWGHAKQELYKTLEAEFGPKRELYAALRADENTLDAILEEGAVCAPEISQATIARVRRAIGIA